MKRTKHLILTLALMLLLAAVAVVSVSALDATGSCGEHVTWSFDEATGELTISGEGEMENYSRISSPFFEDIDIKSLTVKSGVTTIGSFAFDYCSSLVSISISDSVISIGGNAFRYCRGLQSVEIPNSVTRIEEWAFYGCSSLTNIEIPDSVTSIGTGAFFCCSSLTNVTIPNSVMSIGGAAFASCGAMISVTIPDSVTSIGSEAFNGCESLTNVTIPNSVTKINDSTFHMCTSLTSIAIPDSVTSIGFDAFYGCSSLTSIEIPDSVTSIGSNVFSNCSSLASVEIPVGVTSISDHLFYRCSSLTRVTIPDGVTSIGDYAFLECSNLTSFDIPDSVTSIGERAFAWCSSFTSVEISDYVTEIKPYAFEGCYRVTNVTIGRGVEQLDHTFFGSFGQVESIIVSENNPSYTVEDKCLYSKDKTSLLWCPLKYPGPTFDVPDHVVSIGEYAFAFKNGGKGNVHPFAFNQLEHITMPEGVTSIGRNAFSSCYYMADIVIPSSVTFIDEAAFEECKSLSDVFFLGDEEAWNAIEIGTKNDELLNAEIHYNYNPEHIHTPVKNTIPSTCKQQGYTISVCAECGETLEYEVLPKLEHQFSEWVTEREATIGETGLKVRTCSACGEKQEEVIPKLPSEIAENVESGITVSYSEDAYTDQIKVVVEQVFEGSQYLTVLDGNCVGWNIKTLIDGEEVQPTEPVYVEIPLPESYQPEHVFVLHIDIEAGVPQRLDSKVVDGKICFFTASFSPFLIVDESITGHTYTSTITTDPTCSADGETTYTCSVCGDTYTKPIPATGNHVDSDNDGKCDTCNQKMTGGKHCKYCGKIHGGAFGWLVIFFHSIFAIFKR